MLSRVEAAVFTSLQAAETFKSKYYFSAVWRLGDQCHTIRYQQNVLAGFCFSSRSEPQVNQTPTSSSWQTSWTWPWHPGSFECFPVVRVEPLTWNLLSIKIWYRFISASAIKTHYITPTLKPRLSSLSPAWLHPLGCIPLKICESTTISLCFRQVWTKCWSCPSLSSLLSFNKMCVRGFILIYWLHSL